MDPTSGNNSTNPTNNPRLDLLHSSGDNQQLAGAAGSYGPVAASSKPSPPAPRSQPQPSKAPASAASYVKSAEAERPKAPVPPPPLPPEPRNAPEPKLSAPSAPRPNRGGPILIGLAVVLVVGGVVGGGWALLSHRHSTPVATKPPAPASTAVTPAVPTDLNQVDSSSTTISQGAATKKTQITFQFSETASGSGSLTPEVELEPNGTSFTGQPTITGQAVSTSGSTVQLSVNSATLKDGAYHWQARVASGGKNSGWATFGGSASAVAFTVETTAPGAPTVTTVGGAAVANPTTVSSNQPVIVGKTAPGATVTVSITPDSQSFTTTADASGNWTLTPGANIPNGQHQLSITATDAAGNVSTPTQVALSINPVTASDSSPVSGATGQTAPATTTPATHLAATGDNTTLVSALSFAVMVMAAGGIMWVRRRYVAF
jgi:hypothetical protein